MGGCTDGIRFKTAVRQDICRHHTFPAIFKGQKPVAHSGVVKANETIVPVSCKEQRKSLLRVAKKRSGKTKDGAGPLRLRIFDAL
jgi:hypothetical protein